MQQPVYYVTAALEQISRWRQCAAQSDGASDQAASL